MSSLFDEPLPIPGLVLKPNFLFDPKALLETLDEMPWLDDLSRRVQHYGWRYDYRSRTVPKDARLGPLPDSLAEIAHRLFAEGLMQSTLDQAIINEYLPGQGIAAHIDCKPCFGPEIATITLGDAYPMQFTRVATEASHEIWLPVGSVCVMAGPARYEWRHAIAKRKSDRFGGAIRQRRRLVSVTFRSVVSG